MTIAGNITALALRNAGVTGVGQTPSTQDSADAQTILQDMIAQWRVDRSILNIPGTTLPGFPDAVTDVPYWTSYENVLLTCLTVRLRNAYGLPADELMVKLAESALSSFQANNKQFQSAAHPGAVTTCVQAIYLALRYAGRINDQQSVSDTSQDVTDAFAMLVAMVGQWQRKRWLIYDLTETAVVATGGAQYTVGPAGQFAIQRPDRIEAAFARLLPSPNQTTISGLINNGGVVTLASGGLLPTSPIGLGPGAYWNDGGVLAIVSGAVNNSFSSTIDYPLQIIESREDYNRIALKSFNTVPAGVFYDAAWPTGSLYFWPVPTVAQYELHIFTKASLQVYSSTSDALNLPPEYTEALIYNLALRLPGGNVSPAIAGLARASLNTIRVANAQVSALQMPRGLSFGARRGSDYASFMSGL